jgi:hypothetical protein
MLLRKRLFTARKLRCSHGKDCLIRGKSCFIYCGNEDVHAEKVVFRADIKMFMRKRLFYV